MSAAGIAIVPLVRGGALGICLGLASVAGGADWHAELHAGTTRAERDTGGPERVEGAYGIGIGVKYGEWFSTQLDWHTLGENADVPPAACTPTPCVVATPVLAEHAWTLRALPRLPLGERFALELGLGLARWEGDLTVAGAGHDDSGWDPLWSLGFEWRFAERWSATVERRELMADGFELDWTGAALRWRF